MLKSFPFRIGLTLMLFTLAACNAAATPTPEVILPATLTALAPDVDAARAITKLNLNTATEEELLALIPGFGDRMAHEFMEYRPYTSLVQFRQEMSKYVDAAQIAEYEKYVYVPIDINNADAATLQQIPGLDETEAKALISARPFASSADFLAQLQGYVSADEMNQAAAYLSTP